MSAFIHLIADYGHGDPAFSEVIHRLKAADPRVEVLPTAVPPLSTVATGFWIEQLGVHNPAFEDLLIYSNTAPRRDGAEPREENEGENLCYGILDTGVDVVAVDSGYNFSFIKHQLRAFHRIDVQTRGSQFRSRDYFPAKVIEIAHGNLSSVGDELPVEAVPDPPERAVCHIDGYGNIKTSIRASELSIDPGSVTITIGGVEHHVRASETVFAVPEGELVFAPGSTGGADPYYEVFYRGGSAAARFDHPAPGDTIAITIPTS